MTFIERKTKRRNLKKEEAERLAKHDGREPEKVFYARVSRKDLKIENQKQEFYRVHPELKGIPEHHDTIQGDGDRKQLFKLLDELPPGSVIYSIALDRISRSTKSLIEILDICEAREITIVCTRQGNLMTIDRPFVIMLGMVAEMEKKNLSIRTKDGIARTREENKDNPKRGRHWGYGLAKFRGTPLRKTGRRPNEIYAKALPTAKELRQKEFTLFRIAQILTQMFKFEFSEANVCRMLKHGHG